MGFVVEGDEDEEDDYVLNPFINIEIYGFLYFFGKVKTVDCYFMAPHPDSNYVSMINNKFTYVNNISQNDLFFPISSQIINNNSTPYIQLFSRVHHENSLCFNSLVIASNSHFQMITITIFPIIVVSLCSKLCNSCCYLWYLLKLTLINLCIAEYVCVAINGV